ARATALATLPAGPVFPSRKFDRNRNMRRALGLVGRGETAPPLCVFLWDVFVWAIAARSADCRTFHACYTGCMETNLHVDVATLDAPHRRALEEVIGRQLSTDQRLIISVTQAEVSRSDDSR